MIETVKHFKLFRLSPGYCDLLPYFRSKSFNFHRAIRRNRTQNIGSSCDPLLKRPKPGSSGANKDSAEPSVQCH